MLRVIIHPEGDCVGDYKLRNWAGRISYQYSKKKDMEVYISNALMIDVLIIEVISNRINRKEIEILFLDSHDKYFIDKYFNIKSENDSLLEGSISTFWNQSRSIIIDRFQYQREINNA